MCRHCATLAILLVLLCGCGSKIVEGTEITYRGTVIDRALAPVEERPYSIMEETRAYIGIEEADGTPHCFWEAKGSGDDWPAVFVGDAVEITVATEASTGYSVVIGITVLEKGERHLDWEEKNGAQIQAEDVGRPLLFCIRRNFSVMRSGIYCPRAKKSLA